MRTASLPGRPVIVSENQSSLAHYLSVVRRQLWLILLLPVVALATTGAVVLLQDTVYRASTKIVVGQGGGVFQAQFGNAVDPFSATMRNLLSSEIVANEVIRLRGLDMTTDELLKDLNVSVRPQSSVLEVSYDSTDPEEAVRILRAVGVTFTGLVKEKLGGQPVAGVGAESRTPITATVFDPAHLEPDPVAPKPVRSLALAGLVGLILGLVFGLARDSVDNRIRTRSEAEEWFGAPVVGTLPRGVRRRSPLLLENEQPVSGHHLDALHLLRANLEFAQAGAQGPSILVTSAVPQEGKSTVVANLGVALATAGKEVICVEADLRQPKLDKYLGATTRSRGLADVLHGTVPLVRALREVDITVGYGSKRPAQLVGQGLDLDLDDGSSNGVGRLRVVSGGILPPLDPSTLLTPDAVGDLVSELSGMAEYVIFDAPPLLLVADAFPFVLKSDMVLIVARRGKTTRSNAEAVRNTLHGLGAERYSIVLTDVEQTQGYGYGYGRRT